MTTYNQLRARYESATPAERQRALDLLSRRLAPGPSLCDWEAALRAVFEEKDEHQEDEHAETATPSVAPAPLALERTSQGWNYVLPGTAPSAHQAAAARGPKLRPPTKQREPGGMFAEPVPATPDLFP